MEFRKGQKVVLRENLEIGKIYGKHGDFTENFSREKKEKLAGKEWKIEETDSYDNSIKISGVWYCVDLFKKPGVVEPEPDVSVTVTEQLKENNKDIEKNKIEKEEKNTIE